MENSKIILINKKKGISSHKLIKNIQKEYKFSKIGHAGTLDPMAEGLMIAMSDNATKLSDILMKHDKVYLVKMELGYETDTLDSEGVVIKKADVNTNLNEINKVMKQFVGKIMQKPPMYSAIKVNGKKLYELARKNEVIDIKEREIEIYSINDVMLENNTITFRTHVSSGTYIRSLIRDIAYKLNTCATMTYLLREKINNFSLPNDIEFCNIQDCILLDSINLNNFNELKKLLNGINIKIDLDTKKIGDKLHCYYNNQYQGIVEIVSKDLIKKSKFFVKKEKYEKD